MQPRRFFTRSGLCAFALLLATLPGTADPPKSPAAEKLDLDLIPDPDVEWLKRAKVPTDDAGLLKFLRSCQGKDIPPAEIDGLVGKLMSGSKDEHAEAARKLAEAGTVAVPALRRHRTGPDADAARRIRNCLEKIEEAGDKPLARPAMRRLLIRRPAGTAEAMVGYLPFASDPAAEEDIYYGLDQLIDKDPKAMDPLAKALQDAQPARRAVSACILGRRGNADQKQAVRDLLKDPDATVRLRAAQGLLAGKSKIGMPTLIELLDNPSVEIGWQAEELLRWTAIDTAPKQVAGSDKPEASARAAWRKWWTDHGEKLDLAEVEKEPRRPLLLLGYNRTDGRVWLFGCDGETRHEWTTKKGLEDAQYVPGGTVLTLHEQPVREKPLLAERDRSGKVLWQYEDMRDPKSCQRVSNGQVFVAERQDLVEPYLCYQIVTGAGRKVAARPEKCSADAWSVALRRAPNGKIICATSSKGVRGRGGSAGLAEYDPSDDSFVKQPVGGYLARAFPWVEEGRGGCYLISGLAAPSADRAEIAEFATDGYVVWDYRLPGSTFAARLPGGNTMACLPGRVVELTPDKRMIGETVPDGDPDIARPVLRLVRLGLDTDHKGLDLNPGVEVRGASIHRGPKRMRLGTLARLVEAGPDAAPCIPQLQKHQDDPDPDIRAAILRALDAAGHSRIPELLAELKHKTAERRARAAQGISIFSSDPRVVDALIAALQDNDKLVRARVAAALGRMEANPQRILPFSALRGRLRRYADKIVPALAKLLRDEDFLVRTVAIRSLGMMGAAAKPGVPELIRCLDDDDQTIRMLTTRSLGQIGPVTPDVLSTLHKVLLDNRHPSLRGAAATGLGSIGPAAADSVPMLIDAYRAADKVQPETVAQSIRGSVITALGQVGPTKHGNVAFLIDLLKDARNSTRCRLAAAEAVAGIGPPAAAAIPVLTALSQEGIDNNLEQIYARYLRELKHRVAARSP